ncbi:hypothetical protein MXB_4666 [Myxobolus squamalis]|nr:hypothetical protein MXB_4666 [Myxobolus squamalis]
MGLYMNGMKKIMVGFPRSMRTS